MSKRHGPETDEASFQKKGNKKQKFLASSSLNTYSSVNYPIPPKWVKSNEENSDTTIAIAREKRTSSPSTFWPHQYALQLKVKEWVLSATSESEPSLLKTEMKTAPFLYIYGSTGSGKDYILQNTLANHCPHVLQFTCLNFLSQIKTFLDSYTHSKPKLLLAFSQCIEAWGNSDGGVIWIRDIHHKWWNTHLDMHKLMDNLISSSKKSNCKYIFSGQDPLSDHTEFQLQCKNQQQAVESHNANSCDQSMFVKVLGLLQDVKLGMVHAKSLAHTFFNGANEDANSLSLHLLSLQCPQRNLFACAQLNDWSGRVNASFSPTLSKKKSSDLIRDVYDRYFQESGLRIQQSKAVHLKHCGQLFHDVSIESMLNRLLESTQEASRLGLTKVNSQAKVVETSLRDWLTVPGQVKNQWQKKCNQALAFSPTLFGSLVHDRVLECRRTMYLHTQECIANKKSATEHCYSGAMEGIGLMEILKPQQLSKTSKILGNDMHLAFLELTKSFTS